MDSPSPTEVHQSASAEPMECLDIAAERDPRTKLRLWAILIGLYLALFLAALDATIMATAIPTISAHFNSGSAYVWIAAAYILAGAAAGPIWAKCSDIWGRKPVVLTAVVVFAAASIFAALSVNISMLIAGRALQGTAAGGLMQLVLITISDMFSMRSRVLYLGLTEVIWAIAGGAGPLVGGAFTELVSWRWCFYVNLPFAAVSFLLLLLFLDVHNPRTKFSDGIGAIDWFGLVSMLAVTLMLLLGLDFGGVFFPWSSPKVICLIVFGTAMVGCFLFSEKRLAKFPLMPLSVFNNRSNAGAFIVGLSQGMCFIAAEYYMPLYFQSVKAASPLRSGLLILPITVSEAAFGIFSGIFMHRTGRYRELIWVGLLIMTVGTGLYINFGVNTSIAMLVGFMLVEGSGCGLLFEAPIISIQNTVSQGDTSMATATFGFLRNIATSTSIVVGGVVFQNGMVKQASALRSAGLDATLVQKLTGGQAAANTELVRTLADAAQRFAVQKAFATSLQSMWIMYTCIAAVGLVAGLLIRQQDLSQEHTETRTGIEQMSERKATNTEGQ
ncbi:hypothetical protein BAUCODRAFT_130645 [Baudoinia panamericana UAMH 10762]|uniref:Major facilitator superfamily (MFS) profile domain-containing protein n=1 Tax=Baudoinia panamericana (strain UAMH 10762) TaxID=717646 RepID=M2N0S7_BAUPA|nr:uncharacterized protein BAUCODRAFT_130645 [Baudoinia panamericana UAMH 10762]EMC97523.1 hypothetical protein BAUCODRAFT_130645 [Baudoinia panamericana UAMH 10762]